MDELKNYINNHITRGADNTWVFDNELMTIVTDNREALEHFVAEQILS